MHYRFKATMDHSSGVSTPLAHRTTTIEKVAATTTGPSTTFLALSKPDYDDTFFEVSKARLEFHKQSFTHSTAENENENYNNPNQCQSLTRYKHQLRIHIP